jgi:pimeloyl-ACP methyl ester carboxylesterase
MPGSIFDTAPFNERLFFPRRDGSVPPRDATDLAIAVEGATLHLRWHRPLAGARTLLLFHGNGEVVADYDDAAGHFAACGANLAVVDYRGYGQSTGTPTLRDALSDAPLVVDALIAAGATRLVVMGRSLGSASAAVLYARPAASITRFVWESGFVDLGALVRRRGLVLPQPLPPEDVETFDARTKLARGDRPLLVLHGAEDSLIVPSEATLAFEAAGTKDKELVFIAGRGHNDLSAAPAYWEALARHLAS